MITCKNCSHSFEGNYCNTCGQSAETHRLSWHELIHHLPHAFFHVDAGLFYTIKELTIRPGIAIRNYLEGKRVGYFNPFLYLIMLGGFASVLYVSMHESPMNKAIELEKLREYSSTIAYKYFALVGGLFIFLLSATDHLFYFRKKYVLPEIIVSNTFQVGQIMFFVILALPLLLLQRWVASSIGMNIELRPVISIMMLGYLFFVRFQFYEAGRNFGMIIRIVVQLILVFTVYSYLVSFFMASGLGQVG